MLNNETRKANYKRLRQEGFTSDEATRFKNFSQQKINDIISIKKSAERHLSFYKDIINTIKDETHKRIEKVKNNG